MSDNLSRRDFLKLSGLFGAVLAFPKVALESAKDFCKNVGRFWLPKSSRELHYALKNARHDDIIFLESANNDC